MNKLFEIQKKLEPIKKDKENPYHKSWYFDINKILEILKPMFNEMNIRIEQSPFIIDSKNAIFTKLIDTEGDNEVVLAESSMFLPEDDNPQHLGSAITYCRRYMLVGMLGLEAEDDDGNKASQVDTVAYVTRNIKKAAVTSPIPETVVGGGIPVIQNYECPKCGKPMAEKNGKFGKFYGCSNYPDCTGIRDGDGKDRSK